MTPTPLRQPAAEARLPPANTEAEQALLGSILTNNAVHARVAAFLLPEHFANGAHGRIFAAIGELIGDGVLADPITLKGRFDQDGSLTPVGGTRYLAQLAGAAGLPLNAEHYARAIVDAARRRTVIAAGQDLVDAAYDGADVDNALSDVMHRIRVEPSGPPGFRDPWDQPPTPEWPGGVLPPQFEDMIAAIAELSGIDPGAAGIAALAAGSGAIPKNCSFRPYGSNHPWRVPPIVWAMLVARSGQRKTSLDALVAAFRNRRAVLWRAYRSELDAWKALPAKQREETVKPSEPYVCIVEDLTPEKLQAMLAETERGVFLQRDELASFFSFGRYANDRGGAERGFYLEAYDGGSYTVHRRTREPLFIEHAAVAIFGAIQQRRLKNKRFDDLGEDGLLQRFITIMPRPVQVSRMPAPGTQGLPGRIEFNNIIGQLLDLESLNGREFYATPDGAAVIHSIEELGLDLSELSDYGPVFPEFCAKLHGTAARLAFVLHLLDHPDAEMRAVHTKTIARADRLMRQYVLPHARNFYAEMSGQGPERTRAIAAWLLTDSPTRMTASAFGKHIRSCRDLSLTELRDALDPLVGGGWLTPESRYPNNNAWQLDLNVRQALAHRIPTATTRRQQSRRLAEKLGWADEE
jgi:Protein of unknown function (DUF3987)/DnaB-like helicase N terminal domain